MEHAARTVGDGNKGVASGEADGVGHPRFWHGGTLYVVAQCSTEPITSCPGMLRLSEDDERTYVGISRLVSHGVRGCGRGMAEARQ